jgi:hypothetical protein
MANPTMTAQVTLTFDATTSQITMAGNEVLGNEIRLHTGIDWTVLVDVVTVNPPAPNAVLQNVSFDSPGQPHWLSSNPQASGSTPAWTFLAQGGLKDQSVGVDFFVGLPGTEPTMLDPTIINVDPPIIETGVRRNKVAVAV